MNKTLQQQADSVEKNRNLSSHIDQNTYTGSIFDGCVTMTFDLLILFS